jgi:hypothetical protein
MANSILRVAHLLLGDYERADYGKVILPWRPECVREPTRALSLLAERGPVAAVAGQIDGATARGVGCRG